MNLVLASLASLSILAATVVPLTGNGGAFDTNGNNSAASTISSSTSNCPPIQVSVSYNSADGSVSIAPNTGLYVVNSGTPSQSTTLDPGGNGAPIVSGPTTPAGVAITSLGNLSCTTAAEETAAGMIGSYKAASGGKTPSSVITNVVYTFRTVKKGIECSYTVTLSIVHDNDSGQAISASVQ